ETQLAHANEIRRKMWQKSFVKSKPNIYKSVAFLPVSKSISKSRQAYNVMTNNINNFKQICDDAWTKHLKDLFRVPTALDIELLIQTCFMPLAIKTQGDSLKFVHELKHEMHSDLKYVESLEKEIDALKSEKAELSNMYNEILQDCVSKDVMCSYLMYLADLDALAELQCMYLHKLKECDCLAQKLSKHTESVNKKVYTELLQRFAKLEQHSISLEIALQKCKEHVKNDTVCNEKASNVLRKEREPYFKIQNLKAQMQDKNIAISELKKLIEKGKGNSVDTKFDRPSVVRQPNAQRILKPSILGLSRPVTAQTLPQTAKKAVSNTNVLRPGMVNHKPNVSRPQLKSNQSRDKVLPNNSQVKVKKTQVEVHPRIPSVSNKIKSIVQLIICIVDSGYTKHMTGNLKLLYNFVEKFMGTVRFGNDQFAPILGFGDLV
nr:integrase, catalytic region, zinc finger, CCHC-type, peptidase aspartic, catalytic [Tanacetum cinerariifolium]